MQIVQVLHLFPIALCQTCWEPNVTINHAHSIACASCKWALALGKAAHAVPKQLQISQFDCQRTTALSDFVCLWMPAELKVWKVSEAHGWALNPVLRLDVFTVSLNAKWIHRCQKEAHLNAFCSLHFCQNKKSSKQKLPNWHVLLVNCFCMFVLVHFCFLILSLQKTASRRKYSRLHALHFVLPFFFMQFEVCLQWIGTWLLIEKFEHFWKCALFSNFLDCFCAQKPRKFCCWQYHSMKDYCASGTPRIFGKIGWKTGKMNSSGASRVFGKFGWKQKNTNWRFFKNVSKILWHGKNEKWFENSNSSSAMFGQKFLAKNLPKFKFLQMKLQFDRKMHLGKKNDFGVLCAMHAQLKLNEDLRQEWNCWAISCFVTEIWWVFLTLSSTLEAVWQWSTFACMLHAKLGILLILSNVTIFGKTKQIQQNEFLKFELQQMEFEFFWWNPIFWFWQFILPHLNFPFFIRKTQKISKSLRMDKFFNWNSN